MAIKSNLDPGITAASVNAQGSEKGNRSINDKMPMAMFVIVILLVLQFNSIRRPVIILLTIPMAMVGVAAGLLSFQSYFGFMTLLGVTALVGGYVLDNASRYDSPLTFHDLPTPTRAETTEIAGRIADRVEVILKKHGRSSDPDEGDLEPTEVQLEHPLLLPTLAC